MTLIFALGEDQKILKFDLIDYQVITNYEVYSKNLASIALRHQKLSVSNLLELFKHYLGGNFTLKEYVDHIKDKGFYTPYQPSLNIYVEDD